MYKLASFVGCITACCWTSHHTTSFVGCITACCWTSHHTTSFVGCITACCWTSHHTTSFVGCITACCWTSHHTTSFVGCITACCVNYIFDCSICCISITSCIEHGVHTILIDQCTRISAYITSLIRCFTCYISYRGALC